MSIIFLFLLLPSAVIVLWLQIYPPESISTEKKHTTATELWSLTEIDTLITDLEVARKEELSDKSEVSIHNPLHTNNPPDKGTEHTAVRFLMTNPTLSRIFFMVLYVALLAPILEEFIFRLILQGWLDAREREWFRGYRGNGWRSMILVAILFSLLHYHAAGDFHDETTQKIMFNISALTNVVILVCGIQMLRRGLHLTWREIGLDLRYWRKDFRLGLCTFFAAAFPSYLIQQVLSEPLKEYCSADFIALLPIAVAFGILYWRTRRLLPGIVAHCLYNAYALIQLLFYIFILKEKLPM